MFSTVILTNYLTLQEVTNTSILIHENELSTITMGQDLEQAKYTVEFQQIRQTQQPKKVVQLKFQSLADMEEIQTVAFMEQGKLYNAAQIDRNTEKLQITAYIIETVEEEVLLYDLYILKQENSQQEINISVFAAQDIVITEKRRYVIDRQQLYGYYLPESKQTMELMFSNVEQHVNFTIYVSQDALLPSAEENIFTQVVSIGAGQQSGSCELDQELFDYTKPIYIHVVGNINNGSYVLSIAPKGYFVNELLEDYRTTVTMPAGTQQAYIFQPYWTSYVYKKVASEKTLFQIEASNQMLQKLIDQNIDIYGYVSRLTQPETRYAAHQFSLKQHAIIGQDGKAYIKHLELVNTPQESELFITFTCEGQNCSQLQEFGFNVTVNTMSEISQWKPTQAEYIQLRDDNKAQNFYFNVEEYMQTIVDILPPETKGRLETLNCSQIKYKAIACIGTYPDQLVRENVVKAGCYEYQIDQQTNKIQINIDPKNDQFASGNVYIRVEQDISQLEGLKSQVSQCSQQVKVFNNKLYSHYGEPTQYYVVSGYGEVKALRLVADIPVMSRKAAKTTQEAKQYGDRLVLKWKADHAVHICISDVIDNYYPYVTEQMNTCNLYYNEEGTSTRQEIIEFQNYRNNRNVGPIAESTRIYVSAWTSEKVEDGRAIALNLTLAPQYYINYDATIQGGVSFGSSYRNYLDKYINFAVDIDGHYDEVQSGSLIVGADVDNPYYRNNSAMIQDFFQQSIVTYAGCDTPAPYQDQYTVKSDSKGLQVIPISQMTQGQMTTPKTLYFQIKYRKHNLLEFNHSAITNIGYKFTYAPSFGSQNELQYQSAKNVTSEQDQESQQHFYLNVPYVPSELIVYPCKGTQTFYLDKYAYSNINAVEGVSPQQPGRPSYYVINDETDLYFNQYLTVVSSAQSEYQILVGNQANINTPGNDGQITVKEFNLNQNKLTIKIAPARQPLQTTTVSSINYQIYVIPYNGQMNPETDYSPYTKCGIDKRGYSVYKSQQGNDYVTIDEEQVQKDGYITITANQELLQNNATQDSQLYVQVFAGSTPYAGALLGAQQLQTMQSTQIATVSTIAIISLAVVAVIAMTLTCVVLKLRKSRNNTQQQMI